MAYIPAGTKWYVAEIVEEITVADEVANVVHLNLVLIRADSPAAAYDRSIALGKEGNVEYKNSLGKEVKIRFRGLKSLRAVYDELGDGAELSYSEAVGMPEDEIVRLLTPREFLGAFAPAVSSAGPDYACGEVVEEAKRLMRSDSEAND